MSNSITHPGMPGNVAGIAMIAAMVTVGAVTARAATEPLIGYTEHRTDLPGGRAANVMTSRAMVVRADGTGRRELAPQIIKDANTWTQFAGWSPDGRQAIVNCGWESSANAAWEEEHKTFRMEPGQWLLDCYLVDLETGAATNLTAVERVSHYNAGLFFWPGDPNRLGFNPLIQGESRPYSMNRDGTGKKDLSQQAGFAYGFNASPDGKRIAYHQDYQVYLADADGANARKVETGHPFGFCPAWSPDGQWVEFLSGEHYNCHPHLVKRDGTGLRKLADRGGYKGTMLFLDVPDYHEGSSDLPCWAPDSQWVCYTAKVGEAVELMRVWLDGKVEPLSHSKPGVLHYHPKVSPDGKRVVFGSTRDGVRQLWVAKADGSEARPITALTKGHAAMHAHWQPVAAEGSGNRLSTGHEGKGNPMHKLFLPGEINERVNCCDRIEPLHKHPANPLLVADRPWETAVGYPCVLYSAKSGTFRMWYHACKELADRLNPTAPLVDGFVMQYEMYLCYAESADGLTWTKPAVNRLKVKEYGPNNIVVVDSGFIGGQGTVIEDATDPDPDRRFKLLIYDNDGKGRDGIRTAVSPDGLDWTFIGDFPILPSQDTPSLWHDRRRGRYLAFLKTRLDGKRARMLSVSENFVTWSEPQALLAPDLADAPTLEFYAQHAFHHWGHDLGLLNGFDLSTQRTDLELIAAPDGLAWRRLPTRPRLLGPGDPGAWDSGGVYPGTGDALVFGDRCGLYYAGTSQRHDGHDAVGTPGIGLATFAPGRLAGQQFTGDGWCQTIPFRCPGGRLTLNAVAHKPMTVEIHSAGYGGPIPGFTRDACAPVSGDSQAHAITWKEHATIDALRDRFILVRVYGSTGLVFGFAAGD